MPTVAYHTLGCKLNFAETSTIARQFSDLGFLQVDFNTVSDVYVINTCSVTENADKECKTHVKRALQANADGFIIIVGCYAQLKPEEIATIPGVDLVLGAQEKFNISSFLQKDFLSDQYTFKKQSPEIHSCQIEEVNHFISGFSTNDRTRAFLKVQDGCDYKCTYCTIPLARGISRSDTMENVIQQAKSIAEQGIKEIVLTGVNVGDFGKGEYGNKKHDHTFFQLVESLENLDQISRIRISSIEPNLLRPEIIKFVSQSKKFVPHFHIPLQSGSNTVLRLMKRRYNRELYLERVNSIKDLMPDAAIGVDVITGFPGETEQEFSESYHFIKDLDISYLHVFTYSERKNTPAAGYDNKVSLITKKERTRQLRILSEKKKQDFYSSQIGRVRTVLWETENKSGEMLGYTKNYLRVVKAYDEKYCNKEEKIKILKLNSQGNLEIIPFQEEMAFQKFLLSV